MLGASALSTGGLPVVGPTALAGPGVPLVAVAQAVAVVVLLGLVVVHALLAAVAARFFRLRLATRWGAVVYTALLVPLLYVATTVVVLGALGVGSELALDRGTLLVFLWALPFALGVALEVFWFPPPEAVEVPADRGG